MIVRKQAPIIFAKYLAGQYITLAIVLEKSGIAIKTETIRLVLLSTTLINVY